MSKHDNFKLAYYQFDIDTVAAYSESDLERLLSDPGIIRNKLKVNAAIYNAQQLLHIKAEYVNFNDWLYQNHLFN